MNAESVVRMLLSQEFRMPFTKMTLEVGTAIDGKPALKEFDAVSGDQRVIAMVKNYTAMNIKGNQTRHARVMRDLYYLSLCQAEHRFLFLSSPYYDWLKTQRDAAIAPGIKLRPIPKLGLAGYPTVSGTQS